MYERGQGNHLRFVGLHRHGGFKYSISGKVLSITNLGTGAIHQEIGRILRRIEHWHQGPVVSYRILYQDAAGLGGEVKWDGENAEVIAPRGPLI